MTPSKTDQNWNIFPSIFPVILHWKYQYKAQVYWILIWHWQCMIIQFFEAILHNMWLFLWNCVVHWKCSMGQCVVQVGFIMGTRACKREGSTTCRFGHHATRPMPYLENQRWILPRPTWHAFWLVEGVSPTPPLIGQRAINAEGHVLIRKVRYHSPRVYNKHFWKSDYS